jgi:hypothetical protein
MTRVSLLDNTPWWLPEVSTGGAAGMTIQRCDPFGAESQMKGLEGGFYGPEHLGEHMWHCKARADGRFRLRCRCAHRGHPMFLCYGHARMILQRMSGVCPRCVHPPREIEIQQEMQATRDSVGGFTTLKVLERAETRLWDLQAELNWLVDRGIAHRCPVTLEEVS